MRWLYRIIVGTLALAPGLVSPAAAEPVTPATFNAALSSAQGGERFELAGGDYGSLKLRGMNFPADVTIVSADPDDPAILRKLELRDVSHLVFEGIIFDYVSTAGDSAGFRPFNVLNSSHITIRNSVFAGDLAFDGSFGSGKGLQIKGSSHIVIERNVFFHWWKAMGAGSSTDITVRGNEVHSVNNDAFTFTAVDRLLIEGNWIHDFLAAPTSRHRDMIQLWNPDPDNPARNVIIRGNFLDGGTGSKTQTIFMRNGLAEKSPGNLDLYFRNILIEDNVIYNGHVHGITVGETVGLVIRNNTLLLNRFMSDAKTAAPQLRLSQRSLDVTIENNISHKGVAKAPRDWVIGRHLVVQSDGPGRRNYYLKLFVNALGPDPDLADLRAKPGGLIETLGVGAQMTRSDISLEVGPTIPRSR